jgi:hypothetical protein
MNRIVLAGEGTMGKLNMGADQAKRWRDQAVRGRRRRLSRNVAAWVLILTAMIVFSGLIAFKAYT